MPGARRVFARFQLNAVKALAEAMLVQAAGLGSDAGVADLFHRRGIRAKSVRDDARRSAVFLHDPFQKLRRWSNAGLQLIKGEAFETWRAATAA